MNRSISASPNIPHNYPSAPAQIRKIQGTQEKDLIRGSHQEWNDLKSVNSKEDLSPNKSGHNDFDNINIAFNTD